MSNDVRVLFVGEHDAITATGSTWEGTDSRVSVIREESPYAALRRLGTDDFDCVVCGDRLDGMSDLEFAARVGRDHPELPTVMLSDAEGGVVATESVAGDVTGVSEVASGDPEGALVDRITAAVERLRATDPDARPGDTADRSRRLAQRTHDAILTVDADERIEYASPSVERIFGYAPSELEGEPFTAIIADRLEEQYHDAVARYLKTGAVQLNWQSLQVPGKHRDGTDVPLMLSIIESEGADGALTVVVRDLSDQAHLETELEAHLDRIGDGFFALDTDFRFTYANQQARELLGLEGTDFVGDSVWDRFPGAVGTGFEDRYERAMDRQEPVQFEEYYEPFDVWFEVRAYPSETGLSVYFRDVTEEKERQQALERRQARLETVVEISGIIGDINAALIDATAREEIERLVCTRIVDSAYVGAAWVGHVESRTGRVVPSVHAGFDDPVDDLGIEPDDDSALAATVRRAVEDETVRVADGLTSEPYDAVAAIPIVHQSTTYGVLVCYTDDGDLFDGEVVRTLTQLRDVVGNAISAGEQKVALMADRSVELELRVRDPEEYFLAATREAGIELELDGTVAQGDGTYLEYYTARGDDVEAFTDRIAGSDRIEDVTTIEQSDGSVVVSMVFESPKVSELLAQHGGTFRELVIDEGVATVVADFPRAADIRAVVESFEREFETVELRAKRERKNTGESSSDLQSSFDDELTDRQREAIETAHHAGYFDWPRESDAEEIADALGISSPTLHEHLRAAQHKLLSSLLDDDRGAS